MIQREYVSGIMSNSLVETHCLLYPPLYLRPIEKQCGQIPVQTDWQQ